MTFEITFIPKSMYFEDISCMFPEKSVPTTGQVILYKKIPLFLNFFIYS